MLVGLRETAIHLVGVHEPARARALQICAMRCTSAFDAQFDQDGIDTGRISKINVVLVDPTTSVLRPWTGALPAGADRGELTTQAPTDLRQLLDASAEGSVELMFQPYWRAMIDLAEQVGWDAEDFELAGRRALAGGLLARLHREKRNRTGRLVAVVDGVVQTSGIDLTLRIIDARSGAELAKDVRRDFGDYWVMKDAVHRITWTGQTVEVLARPRSLALGRPWVLAL